MRSAPAGRTATSCCPTPKKSSCCAARGARRGGGGFLGGAPGRFCAPPPFFVGAGAYTAAYFGGQRGWSMPAYLLLAALIGFVVGGVVGPFALRLRGNYLVIVTLGLVFLGQHLWSNWDSVTGGGTGISLGAAPMSIGPLDFKEGIELGGEAYTFEQSFFWLVWGLVALGALLAKNVVRSRPGRAMQAIRDRDLSAEVIGVSLARYKVGAFAWSSAYAAVAGALFVWGGRSMIEQNSGQAIFDPLITTGSGETGIFTIGEFNAVLYGLAIVLFLLFQPRGLAAFWFRVKSWFLTWPFSY